MRTPPGASRTDSSEELPRQSLRRSTDICGSAPRPDWYVLMACGSFLGLPKMASICRARGSMLFWALATGVYGLALHADSSDLKMMTWSRYKLSQRSLNRLLKKARKMFG